MGQAKKRSQLLCRALQDERAKYALRSGVRRFRDNPGERKVVGMSGRKERVSMVVDGGMVQSGAVKSWKAVGAGLLLACRAHPSRASCSGRLR